MRKATAIAKTMLLDSLRDRSSLVSMILFPLLFTGLVGGVFGFSWGSGGSGSVSSPAVALVDLDSSDASRKLSQLLSDSFHLSVVSSEDEALGLVQDITVRAAVIIPAGFGKAVETASPSPLELIIPQGMGGAQSGIEVPLSGAVDQIRSAAIAANVAVSTLQASEPCDLESSQIREDVISSVDQMWQSDLPVTVEEVPVSPGSNRSVSIPQTPMDQASIGFLVMFVMDSTAVAAGEVLAEKKHGTWGRLLSTPTSAGTLLLGKLMGLLAMGWLQSAILIAGGQWIFGVDWGSSPLWVWAIITSLILAASGLGLLIAAFAKTYAQVVTFSNVVLIPTSMLAGVYWPFEVIPPLVQRIAVFFPQRHAVAALIDLVVRKSGPSPQVLQSCGILLAFAAAFMAIGARAVKYN